jgi:transposase
MIASLIGACKLNAADPHAWLADTLRAIVAGHPQNRVGELLPWHYPRKV